MTKGESEMKTIDDGGAAFPGEINDPEEGYVLCSGMSLRDWFAGQALIALSRMIAPQDYANRGAELIADVAVAAYGIADTMIQVRKLPPGVSLTVGAPPDE